MPFIAHRALGLAPLLIDSSWGFRTIPEGMAYCLCKSLHCRDCGHLFVDYRFNDQEMQALYADYRGDDYTQLRELYEPGYTKRNSMLSGGSGYKDAVEGFLDPFLPQHSLAILDWGGDTGVNTPYEDRRHCLDIYDPSQKPLQFGTSIASSGASEQNHYDLIVLSEVLEHIPFPKETLQLILPRMSADTILYVEFPFENLQRSEGVVNLTASKRHWHEHINFFTLQSACSLFAKCGLVILAHQILSLGDDLRPSSMGNHQIFMFAIKRQSGH